MPSFRIFAAMSEDMNQGWVWTNLPGLPQRGLVSIHNPATDKTVYCETLQIDPNFLKNYNRVESGRVAISGNQPSLVLNQWYRARLGNIETRTVVELEILHADNPRAFVLCVWHHPQIIVRSSFAIAVVGILLGLLSIVISLLP